MSSSAGIVIADTSGIIAAFDEATSESDRALSVLKTAGLLVVSPLILAELDHVGRREVGHRITTAMLEDIAAQVRLDQFDIAVITSDIFDQANSIRTLYPTLRIDLADAITVVLAAEYETDAILTLDRRDFRVLTPLTAHKAFRLLPDDL